MEEKGRVCVTGAGGYLASWVVKLLLSKGYKVHGTVRDPDDIKNMHLKKLENASEGLQLFKADLLDTVSLSDAISGCAGVFHIASPVPPSLIALSLQMVQEELMQPAVTGTRNVLDACLKSKIKKIVVASSLGAVFLNPNWPRDRAVDEECWSDLEFCKATKNWYCMSKTLAESEAWEYARTSKLNIVTICPSIVLGPMLQPTLNTSSLSLLKFLKDGMEAADSGFRHFVDVRDTAEAVLIIYKKAEAEGRYVCSSHGIKTQDLVAKLKSMYPYCNYPKSFHEEVPEVKLSSEKLQKLGWSYLPLEETLVDSIKNYEEIGALTLKYKN
ncbi:hypothetical protein SLE2022_175030 [Rubroshorea leprosula]